MTIDLALFLSYLGKIDGIITVNSVYNCASVTAYELLLVANRFVARRRLAKTAPNRKPI